jgi:CubicO group peptidase (beta-lactamase class C family)
MKDTGFSVPAENIDRLTTSYGTTFETGALELYDAAEGGSWSTSPAFPSGAGGLVSTIDDYLSFAQMLLNGGKLGDVRILSRPTVDLMTTNQLTAEQRVSAGFLDQGWGFGVSMVLERRNALSIGTYGWDGRMGTVCRNDPREDLISLLLTQASWTNPNPPAICRDFWTSTYASLDD